MRYYLKILISITILTFTVNSVFAVPNWNVTSKLTVGKKDDPSLQANKNSVNVKILTVAEYVALPKGDPEKDTHAVSKGFMEKFITETLPGSSQDTPVGFSEYLTGVQIQDIDLGGFRLLNLSDPIEATDGVSLKYLQEYYLPKSDSASIEFVNEVAAQTILDAVSQVGLDYSSDLLNETIQKRHLVNGDTGLGKLGKNIDMNDHQVNNLSSPYYENDAATKSYVDQAVGIPAFRVLRVKVPYISVGNSLHLEVRIYMDEESIIQANRDLDRTEHENPQLLQLSTMENTERRYFYTYDGLLIIPFPVTGISSAFSGRVVRLEHPKINVIQEIQVFYRWKSTQEGGIYTDWEWMSD